jgi:UDPglucose 6-dehydrogenase
MAGDVLVDGRNALDGAKAAAAGLRYEGMGRSSHEPAARAASPVSGG